MKDKLQQIAEAVLHLETLESRNSDRLDFHDLSVWSIEEALREAYIAGQQSVVDDIEK
jgi:hypothetical protein